MNSFEVARIIAEEERQYRMELQRQINVEQAYYNADPSVKWNV